MVKVVLGIGNVIETIIIFNYWINSFERRFSKKTTYIVYWVASILNVVKGYFTIDDKVLRSITTHLVLIPLMAILFKDKWARKIVVYITYFFCTFMAELVAVIIPKYLFNYELVLDGSVESYLSIILDFLLITLFNFIGLMAIRRGKLDPNSKATQMTGLFLTIQALVAFILIQAAFSKELTLRRGVLITVFTMVIALLVDLLIFRYSRQLASEAAKAEYHKRVAEIEGQHFHEMRKQYDQFRRTAHDYLNHVKVIEGTADGQQREEYVHTLRENLEGLESTSFCNSPTLDALLFFKTQEAKSREGRLHIEICDCSGLTVSDYDLCTIVSNLLDNAIEAVEQTDEKEIKLRMDRKASRLIIKVENSSNPVEGDFQTTKDDKKAHGFGLESIKVTAQKYDGDALFRYHDGEFTSVVNLTE